MKKIMLTICLMLCGMLVVVSGCTEAQSRTIEEGGASILGGLATGERFEDSLIKGAIQGGKGWMQGSREDQRNVQTQAEIDALRYQQNTEAFVIRNSNGSTSTIILRKDSAGYIGPKGERYATRPTEEQLRPVYGF